VSRRRLRRTDGVFAGLHRELMAVDIDWSGLRPDDVPPGLRDEALAAWQERFETEFRSVQVMNRFLSELLESGDPLEVYAGAVDLIGDEVRHMALCAEVVTGLGGVVYFPEPPAIVEPAAFARAPANQRALATAISMLAVNETLSVAYIEDLRDRCDHPVIRAVLEATVSDETEHEAFGWSYIERSLARFPDDSRPTWRQIARDALAPQRAACEPVLERLPADLRDLARWPDAERATFGLTSPERQALVYERTVRTTLAPRLEALGLW